MLGVHRSHERRIWVVVFISFVSFALFVMSFLASWLPCTHTPITPTRADRFKSSPPAVMVCRGREPNRRSVRDVNWRLDMNWRQLGSAVKAEHQIRYSIREARCTASRYPPSTRSHSPGPRAAAPFW
jgi:hypothetical protein